MSQNSSEHTANFLLAEYNALQQRAIHFEDAKSTRVNYFLIIVAASIAGVSTLLGAASPVLDWRIVLTGVTTTILLLGVGTLSQTIDFSIAIVTFYRKASRVRRWFLEQDKTLEKYLAFSPNDDSPRLGMGLLGLSFRGGDAVLLFTNALSFSILMCTLTYNGFGDSVRFQVLSIFGYLFAGVLIQWLIIRLRLHHAGKRLQKDVRFPK